MPIYLDHAAATPLDSRVATAMRPFLNKQFFNPSATYLSALKVRDVLKRSRSLTAHHLGANPGEIIFTAGGSEANNLAIHGVMRQYPGANIVVSGIEHESVLAPAGRYDRRIVKVGADGRVDFKDLAEQIDNQTVLVSIMYANNEIGTVQSLQEATQIIKTKRTQRQTKAKKAKLPLYFHTDACQAANYLDLHVARLGVDMMSLNGGKIYGPKQSGALFVKAGLKLIPLIDGGGQEQGLRSGTENIAGIVGFAKALDLAQLMRHQEVKRLQTLQQQFFKLLEEQLPAASINGSRKQRLPNNLHISLPDRDNERLLIELDLSGIQAAAGSACSASDVTPSHVLRAIGLSDQAARASLRLTIGRTTSLAEVKQTVKVLAKLYSQAS